MIEVFTDGSADNMEQKVGGIGVFFFNPLYHKYNKSIKIECNNCTNQKMELMACIEAIETVIKNENITNKKNWDLLIYTDSMYVIKCMTEYAKKWIKYGWFRDPEKKKKIINLDLVKKLYVLTKCYEVKFKHSKAHKKQPKDTNSQEWKEWYGNKNAHDLAFNIRNN